MRLFSFAFVCLPSLTDESRITNHTVSVDDADEARLVYGAALVAWTVMAGRAWWPQSWGLGGGGGGGDDDDDDERGGHGSGSLVPGGKAAAQMQAFQAIVNQGARPDVALLTDAATTATTAAAATAAAATGATAAAASLLERCWDRDDKKRPTLDEAARELREIAARR